MSAVDMGDVEMAAAACLPVSEPKADPGTPVAAGTPTTTPNASSSTRRGKQYKCGMCHELGHNSKTCPRRLSSGDESAAATAAAKGLTPPVAAALAPTPMTVPSPALQAAAALPAPPHPLLSPPAATSTPLPPASTALSPRPESERIGALPLDAAIAAARRRVLDAETLVTEAQTAEEYEAAMSQLDSSVLSLERVVLCAQRVAAAVRSYNGV
jgi:hypothetical protein